MYCFLKRGLDLGVALTLCIILLPVGLIIAVLLYSFQRKVFFIQQRPGLATKPFKLVKFCSMRDDRDKDGKLLQDEARITRIGSFIRSASLDELPQLWNVLKGEMSLVGPRPLLMEYLPRYSTDQARRHDVKPGITGWAQVNGRNEVSWSEKFLLDTWYVDHASFWLDLRIIWMTLAPVFRRSGVAHDGHATMPVFVGENADRPSSRN